MRAQRISEVLTRNLQEIGVVVSAASLEEWEAYPHRASPTWRLGVVGPLPYPEPGAPAMPDDPPYLMAIAPAYIEALTDDFDEEKLGDLLDAVLYVADMMIAWGRTIPDERERFTAIEEELLELWPGSLELMSDIEFRSLDAESAW